MFYAYVLYSSTNRKIYIGQTQNLQARLSAHNNKHKVKSFTARFEGEWEVIYQESFATRPEAIKHEKQLKSHQGREQIKKYITG